MAVNSFSNYSNTYFIWSLFSLFISDYLLFLAPTKAIVDAFAILFFITESSFF